MKRSLLTTALVLLSSSIAMAVVGGPVPPIVPVGGVVYGSPFQTLTSTPAVTIDTTTAKIKVKDIQITGACTGNCGGGATVYPATSTAFFPFGGTASTWTITTLTANRLLFTGASGLVTNSSRLTYDGNVIVQSASSASEPLTMHTMSMTSGGGGGITDTGQNISMTSGGGTDNVTAMALNTLGGGTGTGTALQLSATGLSTNNALKVLAGNENFQNLTASQFVQTDGSKNLISYDLFGASPTMTGQWNWTNVKPSSFTLLFANNENISNDLKVQNIKNYPGASGPNLYSSNGIEVSISPLTVSFFNNFNSSGRAGLDCQHGAGNAADTCGGMTVGYDDLAMPTISTNNFQVKGNINGGSLTASNITGIVQCIHADASGNFTGTGADCGAGAGGGGSGLVNTAAQFSVPYYSVAGSSNVLSAFPGVTFSTNTGVTMSTVTISNGVFTINNTTSTINGPIYMSSITYQSQDKADTVNFPTGRATVTPYHPSTNYWTRSEENVLDNQDGTFTYTKGAAGTLSQDSVDFVRSTQSIKLGSDGLGTAIVAKRTSISPTVDFTGQQIVLYFKIDGLANMSEGSFYLSSDNLSANFWTFDWAAAAANQEYAYWQEGEWARITLNFGEATVTGSPSRSAINSWQLRIKDKAVAGSTVTVHWNGLATIPEPPEGIVTITDDDGFKAALSTAAQYMDKYGYRGTAYLEPDNQAVGNFMSTTTIMQLEKLHGWEMGIHPTGTRLPSISTGAVDSIFYANKVWMDAFGEARWMDGLAYPHGGFNPAVEVEARKYFSYARTIVTGPSNANPYLETYPPADPYRLRSISVSSNTSNAQMWAWANRAKQNHEWLILTFHDFPINTPTSTDVAPSTFTIFIDTIASLGLRVQPLGEVLRNPPVIVKYSSMTVTGSLTGGSAVLGTPLPVTSGGTGTTTPGLVQGTNVTITGSWPNQTINASGGGGSGSGTINTAPQFSAPYYSLAGSSNVVSAFPGVTFSTNTGVTISTLTIANGGGNSVLITSNTILGAATYYANGVVLGASINANELSGTLQAAQFPALTGDITTNSGALATTLAASIANAHTWTGTATFSSSVTVNNVFQASTGVFTQNGATPPAFTNAPIQAYGNANAFLQNVVQNMSNGGSASSDYVATSNLGGNTSNYVNLGINSSGFNLATETIVPSTWAYLWSSDHGLAIGAGINGTDSGASLVFFTSAPILSNARMTIYSTGTIQTFGNLQISSGVLLGTSAGTNGQVFTSGGAGTVPTWTTLSGASLASTQTWTGGNTFQSWTVHTGSITFSGNVNISSGVLLSGSAGTNGQFLTSGGPNTIPTWTNATGALLASTQTFTGSNTFSNASNTTASTVIITSTGTGNTLQVNANGNFGTNDGSSGGALFNCNNTGSDGPCVQIYSNQGAIPDLTAPLYIVNNNVLWDNPNLYIVAKGGSPQNGIRIDGFDYSTVALEDTKLTGNGALHNGKFQISSHNDSFRIERRSSDNSQYLSVFNVTDSTGTGIGAFSTDYTLPASTIDIQGSLAVGSGVTGVTAAPSNGLLVQGNSILQSSLTVQGANGIATTKLSATANVVMSSGMAYGHVSVNASYTTGAGDHVIYASSTASGITISLSSANVSVADQELIIYKVDKTTYPVTIQTKGTDTIGISTGTMFLNAPGQRLSMMYNTVGNWNVQSAPINVEALGLPRGAQSAAGVSTSSDTHCTAFYVPDYEAIKGVAFTVGAQAGNYDWGIYDAAGNRLSSLGATLLPAIGNKTASFASPLFVSPGVYWRCMLLSVATTPTLDREGPDGTFGACSFANATGSLPTTLTFPGCTISNRIFVNPVILYGKNNPIQ